MKGTINELTGWIGSRDDIAVIPHVSPDGDALGTALAMMLALEKLGKRAQVVSADATPAMYHFLPTVERIVTPDALAFEPKCLLFVDVASFDRAGDRGALSSRVSDWAVMDHHETNPGFAQVSVVDGEAPASGIMALRVIDELNIALDSTMALLLYAAISTDTGNFSYSNTTSEAFCAAARLLECGFDLEDTNYRLFRLRSVPRAKLLGCALAGMELYENGRMAIARIPQSMLDRCGADYGESEGIINFLVEMDGVELAATIEAREGGKATKFSLRSTGDIDVAAIARSCDGGGHTNAAGMNLDMPLDAAADRAIPVLKKALNA